MKSMLVMTIIGPDRPGLVDSVARLVTEHGGNWLESRMSRLGGYFAGILRVQVTPEREEELTRALRQLENQRLTVVVHPDEPLQEEPQRRLCLLELVGQDRPGIVHQISRALAAQGVNVEELNTECASAAMSGETLFKATARLSLPASCTSSNLLRELEKIAADLIVELSFTEISESSTPAAR